MKQRKTKQIVLPFFNVQPETKITVLQKKQKNKKLKQLNHHFCNFKFSHLNYLNNLYNSNLNSPIYGTWFLEQDF